MVPTKAVPACSGTWRRNKHAHHIPAKSGKFAKARSRFNGPIVHHLRKSVRSEHRFRRIVGVNCRNPSTDKSIQQVFDEIFRQQQQTCSICIYASTRQPQNQSGNGGVRRSFDICTHITPKYYR